MDLHALFLEGCVHRRPEFFRFAPRAVVLPRCHVDVHALDTFARPPRGCSRVCGHRCRCGLRFPIRRVHGRAQVLRWGPSITDPAADEEVATARPRKSPPYEPSTRAHLVKMMKRPSGVSVPAPSLSSWYSRWGSGSTAPRHHRRRGGSRRSPLACPRNNLGGIPRRV